MTRAGAALVGLSVMACGSGGTATPSAAPQPVPVAPAPATSKDSTSSALVPAGFGTLRQEDIAIILQPPGLRVEAIPLDESVIRVLAPDSYRLLRSTLDSKRQLIMQRAASRGVRDPRVWHVTFVGLVPDARFVPNDFTVTSGGREFRPLDVIALTTGFSEQRLQPRETQRALLVFDDALDVSQPVTVTMGPERNTDWEAILQKIDAERASIRARAGARP